MSIKSGQILHDSGGFVIDRIQTGGVTNLNIPKEAIYELGNFSKVETLRDIPDLSFDIESFDVSTEIEAVLTSVDPTTTIAGQEFDFADHLPIDVISPFRSALNQFNIVKGIAIPYLTLESATYRFGVRQNSTQQYTLRGDAVYYIPGTPYIEHFSLVSATSHTYSFAHTALSYTEQGNTLYALAVCVKNPSTNKYRRLFLPTDYTNTSSGFTVLANWVTEGYTDVHVVYGSAVAATYSAAVNVNSSVKPSAVRGKDVCVYVSDGAATPTLVKWTGVQSIEATRRVNLDADEEMCNAHYLSQDYDTADVTGNVVLKPLDPADLWSKIAQVANVATNVVAGVQSSAPLEMEIRINDPETGTTLKTLYVPDARFTIPAVSGRVQQKLTTTFDWESDSGTVLIYQGSRP